MIIGSACFYPGKFGVKSLYQENFQARRNMTKFQRLLFKMHDDNISFFNAFQVNIITF
jgi:hypothetical protein